MSGHRDLKVTSHLCADGTILVRDQSGRIVKVLGVGLDAPPPPSIEAGLARAVAADDYYDLVHGGWVQ